MGKARGRRGRRGRRVVHNSDDDSEEETEHPNKSSPVLTSYNGKPCEPGLLGSLVAPREPSTPQQKGRVLLVVALVFLVYYSLWVSLPLLAVWEKL